ncbi:hypothetical protein BC833DRAFT_601099 [Globomyces pollinis-pini]|nr:hypothetical protein BC833DRAFT_601099 [Globomyces pollinis-pini]
MDHLTVAIKAAYDSTQAYYQSPYTKISLFMNIRNNHGSLIPFNLRVKDCFDPLDHIECVVLPQGISKRKASTDVSNKQNNGSKKSKTEKTLLEMSESEYESEDDISANKNNVAPAAETFNEKTADKITHKVANTVKHNIKEVEEDEESSEEDVQDADAQESESDNDQSDDEDVESNEQEESDEEESDEEVEESGKEEEEGTEQEPEEESEDEVAETEPQVESEEESEEEEPVVEDQVESEDESEEEEVEKPAEKAESESEEESSEEEVAESADESEEGDVEANDEADSEEASEDEDEKVNDESESEEESEEEVKAVDEAESEEEAEVEDEKVNDEAESEEESEEEDVEEINEAESEEESEEEEVKANTEAESEEESEEEDVKAIVETESEEESEVENVETKKEADLENESEEEEKEEVKANDEEESEEEPEEVESKEKILEGIVSDVTDIAESDEEELHEDEKMTNVGLSSGQSQVPDSDEKLESGKDVEMEESDSDKVMDVDQDRSDNATDSNVGDNEETGQTVESEVAVQKKDLETVEYQQNTDLAGEIEHSTQDKEIDGMQEKSNNEFDFELLGGDSAQKQNKKAVTYSKKPIRTPHDRVTRSAKSRSSSANSNLEIMEEDIFSKMNGDVEPRASNGADSVKQLKEKYLSEEPTQKRHNLRSHKSDSVEQLKEKYLDNEPKQKEHNLRSNKAQQELNALEDIEAVEEIETEISLKESNTTSTNSMGMDVSGSPLSSNRNDESSQVLNVRDGYKSIGQPKPICFGSDDEDEDVSYKPKTIDISKVQSKRMTQSSPCSPGKVNKRLSQFSIPNALTDTNEIQVVMDSEEDEPMFSKASISTGELLCEPRVTEIAETETEPDSQVYSQVFASQPFNATQLKVDPNPRNCLSDIKNHTGNNFVDRSTKSMSFHSLFEFDSVVNKAKSPVKAPAVLSDDSSDSDDSDDTSTSEEENHGNAVRLAGKRKRKRKSILLQLAKTGI